MGEAALKRITVDEFLVWDGDADRRYELSAGEIVAMAPPSNAHALIVANAVRAIGQRLKPPCLVLSEVGIAFPFRNDTFYQADVAVTCSPLDPRQHDLPNPVVIIEVLSPSTMAQDRSIKLVDYRHIPSVQEIVFIASDDKRVELWQRGANAWTVVDLEAGDRIHFDAIGFDIPVEALYEGLDLSQGAEAQS